MTVIRACLSIALLATALSAATINDAENRIVINSVSAHSKLYCTDAIEENGTIVGCRGWPNPGSRSVHIWGPNATGATAIKGKEAHASLRGNNDTAQFLLEDIPAGKRTMTTGVMPSESQMARAAPGGKLIVMWSTNNHGGVSKIYREPSRKTVTKDTKEPKLNDWIGPNVQPIAAFAYRAKAGPTDTGKLGGTKCIALAQDGYGGMNPMGQLLTQGQFRNGETEKLVCYATITIPEDSPVGINRFLYYWHSEPNDCNFWDAFYVIVDPMPKLRLSAQTKDSLALDARQPVPLTITADAGSKNPVQGAARAVWPKVLFPVRYTAAEPRDIQVQLFANGKVVGQYARNVHPTIDGQALIAVSIPFLPADTKLTVQAKMVSLADKKLVATLAGAPQIAVKAGAPTFAPAKPDSIVAKKTKKVDNRAVIVLPQDDDDRILTDAEILAEDFAVWKKSPDGSVYVKALKLEAQKAADDADTNVKFDQAEQEEQESDQQEENQYEEAQDDNQTDRESNAQTQDDIDEEMQSDERFEVDQTEQEDQEDQPENEEEFESRFAEDEEEDEESHQEDQQDW